MSEEIELKSCPSCGGDAEMMGDLYPYVECTECSLSFTKNHQYDSDFESAAEQWNSRVSPKEDELNMEVAALREQLHSLFERVSGCEVSEFTSEQVNYLADMIEGQMDANEGCINKLKSENAALRESLRLKEAECEALAHDKSVLLSFVKRVSELDIEDWNYETDDGDPMCFEFIGETEIACDAADLLEDIKNAGKGGE
ncbi:Lar family restriction alleviation protein [Salinivibrio kushneri]|uniref:Lar family restriction alleviation protein n=1 Tax=Salinivibrio kushneri TaxID=1908198 RepID=UPI0009CC1243|nr:Lar family restriction alleviation protein [Salinivibrio kushneri]OOE71730.1 hypothetical protein BZG19_02120 [Salinivibrio kushneri]